MERRKNSYDFIRFVAASLVVFVHAYAVVGLVEPALGDVNIGGISVYVFFMLSGYLITASWGQYPRFNVFMAKRSLRIFPAMIAVTLLSVLVVGPFYTTLSLHHYFFNATTLLYLNNILLLIPVYSLPGVFAHNPYPNAVNGSIWTLPYEFLMYLVVAVLGASRKLNKKVALCIWALLVIGQIMISILGPDRFAFSIFYFTANELIPMSLMFFSGMIAYLYRDKLRLHMAAGIASGLLFVALATLLPRTTEVLACTLLAYSLFAIGSSPLLSNFSKYGDFSYGIYIYHFPILQMLAASFTGISVHKLFALTWPLSIIAGALSWWLIESRALKLKSRINLKKYPILQKDSAW